MNQIYKLGCKKRGGEGREKRRRRRRNEVGFEGTFHEILKTKMKKTKKKKIGMRN